jgi:hypothetical protein
MPPEAIADDDQLYRRLVTDNLHPDGTVNSSAFLLRGRPDPHISVDLARLTTVAASVARGRRPGRGLESLVAGVPRELGRSVRHDPNPPEVPSNGAHSLVEGEITRSKCRQLARATVVVVVPHSTLGTPSAT